MSAFSSDDFMKPLSEEETKVLQEAAVNPKKKESSNALSGVMNDKAEKSLKSMRCPKCGHNEDMDIRASCYMKVDKNGTIMKSVLKWANDSDCHCPKCHWEGDFSEMCRDTSKEPLDDNYDPWNDETMKDGDTSYSLGYNQGHEAGNAEGYADGYDDGYDDGYFDAVGERPSDYDGEVRGEDESDVC